MTNLYVMIAIVLANAIAVGIIYQAIKKLPKKEILIFIAISFASMYMAISAIYWLSGFGIEKEIHEGIKSVVTYLFVPINVLLFIPYLASQYSKLRQKQIKKGQLQKKAIGIGILLVLVLVLEYFCFSNLQKYIINIDTEEKQSNMNRKSETEEKEEMVQNHEIETNEEIMQHTENTNQEQTNQEM